MPNVSVIVPNYNHAHYLVQRIESILNQTYQDFELILLDDCSTDNSREIIEQYRRHPKVSHIIYNDINGGTSYKQWYKGIQYAQGELIWIAESDDWCDLRFLECLVPHFEDKEVALAFCKNIFITNDDQPEPLILTKNIKKTNGRDFIISFMINENTIRNASMVVFRREKYLQISNNRWHTMKLAGDWLLWCTMANESVVVEVVDELNYFRIYDGSTTGRFRKLGYDIIEGLEVLNQNLIYLKNNYPKFRLYINWTKKYYSYNVNFNFKTKLRVLKEYLKYDKIFLFFFIFKSIRNLLGELFFLFFKKRIKLFKS